MDPVVIAAIITAIIGAIGTITAAIITVRANRRDTSVDSGSTSTSQQERNEAPNASKSTDAPTERTQRVRHEPADQSAVATIKRAHELELGTDVVIEGFRP